MAEALESRKVHLGLPFIQDVPFFKTLSKEQQQELCDRSEFLRFSEKQIIFQEGAPAAGGYIVATGRVVMRKETFKKRFVVTELLSTYDPFGMISAVHGVPYPLGAEALRESVVFHIEQDFLTHLSRTYPELIQALLTLCRERLQHSHSIISHLADASSKVRIASALLLVARKFHPESDLIDGNVTGIDITRDEISRIAGTTVETCIRVTRDLEDQGVLELPASRKITIVKPKVLRSLCE